MAATASSSPRRSPRRTKPAAASPAKSEAKVAAKKSPPRAKKRVGKNTSQSSPASPAARSKSKTKSKAKKSNEADEIFIHSDDLAQIAPENLWIDLDAPPEELRPSATLTTGQAFSWLVVLTEDEVQQRLQQLDQPKSAWGVHNAQEWVGPLGNWVISIRETSTTTLYRVLHGSTEGVDEYLRSYFQLDTPLAPVYEEWSRCDERLSRIAANIPGVRILRQDPVECLFSFICSSNNNVPRITSMLASFRETYGEYLVELPCRSANADSKTLHQKTCSKTLYSFPTLDQMQAASDSALRGMGLGYRASYIVETRDLLQEKGGSAYLHDLREIQDADHVQEKLTEFKGVGRKVADCVALFSLDQIEAIPVDTHVWHIAVREYDESLSEVKSLTPTVYKRVGDLFRTRFESHAGWAHSLLFVAELPSFRDVLPADILQQMNEWREEEKAKKAAEKKAKADARKST